MAKPPRAAVRKILRHHEPTVRVGESVDLMVSKVYVNYLMFLRRLAEEAAVEASKEGGKRVEDQDVESAVQHRGYPARASERATLLERIKTLQAEKEVLLAKFEATPTRCTSSQDALDALRELGAQRAQRSDIDAYMSRFMQLGSSWDGTLSQMSALEKNLEPSAILKMFLWALLQNESFFAPSPSRSRSASRRGAARTDRDSESTEQAAPEEGMPWQMLCNALEMDLSRKGAKFHEMRRKAKSLASQLWLAKSRLRMLHETIVTSRDGVDRKCSSLLESLPEKDCIMLLERVEAGTGRPLDSQAPSNFFSSISPWNSES
ncbi:Hypothetical Protein FCC1311_054442 [Hondaea fermentalgiana]|uniref:Transcription factor CBF/NF-Y/archaeal histone domain-containing protein n=1 Tax=Hondaea fermentalgiana TaxID=2315210 RepID=A0A2R5GE55_9STRA|nr:Hypothetical Protein FCC1311_054442 [Hondaea fermentalgiana]|eukprot:GBG29222.1 Hypothetical Protein FCC1311_054442 [Hondaea fermentalgiana]